MVKFDNINYLSTDSCSLKEQWHFLTKLEDIDKICILCNRVLKKQAFIYFNKYTGNFIVTGLSCKENLEEQESTNISNRINNNYSFLSSIKSEINDLDEYSDIIEEIIINECKNNYDYAKSLFEKINFNCSFKELIKHIIEEHEIRLEEDRLKREEEERLKREDEERLKRAEEEERLKIDGKKGSTRKLIKM